MKPVNDSGAEQLTLHTPAILATPEEGKRAIESSNFPFEHLSEIAELESWRKEVNRPVYHIHKWWAQRLGSVFRAVLLGAFAPQRSDILKMFYEPVRLNEPVVFDPFMGSGTTVGEALKLGAHAAGRDINPVAHFIVRNALGVHSRTEVVETFEALEEDVAPILRRFYRARTPDGGAAEVLYYFWVKVIPCPECSTPVDLFSSYVFSRHAYPSRNPEARALCPHCGVVNRVRYDAERAACSRCRRSFSPQSGPVKGAKAACPNCHHTFQIVKAVQQGGAPPGHRLYAKMVLQPDGSKDYLAANEYDLSLYEEASRILRERENAYPVVTIEPGYNTNQVLNYCYTRWDQMFNDRQLLCLSVLAERIRAIPDRRMRDLFVCLFSGTLEFNNMFASFKGEGTGAVRHMFSHHILKSERAPLEANLWGTPKSSGAFSTLFRSRLLRTLDYCEDPFEIRPVRKDGKTKGEKVHGLSSTLGHEVAETFADFEGGKSLYLSCGDSSQTDLPSESVDAVVTDPPFFDNVHYSQLADFFHVWQSHLLREDDHELIRSTRSPVEVQTGDHAVFAERLGGVWRECHRVLRPEGLLVFTYHHSRPDGWRAVLEALTAASFVIVAAHPIKSEMSGATPKSQAREPIDLDVIFVCRKHAGKGWDPPSLSTLLRRGSDVAAYQIARFNKVGRRLSKNDVRVVLMAQIVQRLSKGLSSVESVGWLDTQREPIEGAIRRLHDGQEISEPPD